MSGKVTVNRNIYEASLPEELKKDVAQQDNLNTIEGSKMDVVSDNDKKADQPKDKYNFFFISFMVLGAGFHLPYNSFVAAVDYFEEAYKRKDMGFVVSSTNSYMVCASVILNVVLVNKIKMHARISFGYVAFMISLGGMAVLVALTKFKVVGHDFGLYFTIVATIFTGIGCGVQEASYYGYSGMLPSRYTRAVMLGEAFSGLLVSINRVITKLTIENNLTNTIIFFALSIIGEIACIFLHRYIKQSSFVRFYEAQEQAVNLQSMTATSFSPLIVKDQQSAWSSFKEGMRLRWTVTRKIWKLMIGILNVYLVTNLLYPGVASIIKTSWPNGWLSVTLVFAFNAWDFGGTIATGLSYKMPDNILLLTGGLRWLMVPLLLMCVLPADPIIPGEGVPIIVMSILGFTTGYMGSTPMCAASSQVALEEREMAGNLMTMCMLLGLTLGSTSAMVLNTILGIDNV
ncbi:hypothetical protein ACHWQZ_G006149 [Mnemiopsis leidyi]